MSTKSPILLDLSLDEIISNCGETFTRRGQNYLRQGYVLETQWSEADLTLQGKVSGHAALPYSQYIQSDQHFIDGNCSCPVGYNCKHVAAVLLHWLDEKKNQTGGAEKADDKAASKWREKLHQINDELERATGNDIHPGGELFLYELNEGKQFNYQPGVNIRVKRSRALRKGGFGKEYDYHYHTEYHLPNWATEMDYGITRMILASRDRLTHRPYSIEGVLGEPLLIQLIESGRCYWGEQRETPMTMGDPIHVGFEWENNADTRLWQLHMTLAGYDDSFVVVPTDEAWYINPDLNKAGPILNAPAGKLLTQLREAPALSQQQAQETANYFARHMPNAGLPMPTDPDFISVSEEPTPVLRLQGLSKAHSIADYFVTIAFDYGAYQLEFDGSDTPVERTDDSGNTVIINRDLSTELEWLVDFNKHCPLFVPADGIDSHQFDTADRMPRPKPESRAIRAWCDLLDSLEELIDKGWMVLQLDTFNLEFERDFHLDADISRSDNNWFDVALNLRSGDEAIPLLPLVSDWLEQNDPTMPLFVKTESGHWLEVPASALQPVIDVLFELYDATSDDTALSIPAHHAVLLDRFEQEAEEQQLKLDWRGSHELQTLAEKFRTAGELPLTAQPEGLQAKLRDYQRYGLTWMQFLFELGFNGILADDMGLGKTLQTLALFQQDFNDGKLDRPALVVAPTSVLGNWLRECQKFTPQIRAMVLHGPDRSGLYDNIRSAHLVITSYQIMLRDFNLLNEYDWRYLVLDEAQMIKNPKAKIAKAAKQFDITRRLCLTGTPMENHLGELWSLFDFLMPGFLDTQKNFTRKYRTPIEKHQDVARREQLTELISVFLLRRRKEQVATELPPKTEIVRQVELGMQQSRLYESIRISMESHIRDLIRKKGYNRSHIEILDALLKLRQTCCHPQLVKLDSAKNVTESAKTALLMEMLQELVAEKKSVLVFSQFAQMLRLLEPELNALDIPYLKLTGQTRNRTAVVDQFQNGDVPVFLISLKAGGTGLNLTAADTVIHYDPWWNPAVENQASDRAHRIGQTKPVFVYKLVGTDTVEEKILTMQQRKQRLADSTLNRDNSANPLKSLSESEILQLFT